MLLKRHSGYIILIILIIGIIVIPVSIISVLVNLEEISINPKWDYYVESGIYSAQEEIYEANISYTLWTYLNRDFFPPTPPGGRPLTAHIRVFAYNVDIFPLSTKIERLWIINGTNIKSTLATDEYSIDGSIFEMTFRDGPKWEPGLKIDVVVKLNISNSIYYLKAVNQTIHFSW